jgi:hypothetical protein
MEILERSELEFFTGFIRITLKFNHLPLTLLSGVVNYTFSSTAKVNAI